MEITDVRIRKVTGEGKLKAYVSITFDDIFVIHDLKIIEGKKGYFVAMPSKKMSNGEFKDTAHPLVTDVREKIQDKVLVKYSEETGEEAISAEA
ncbi:MAG: septation regulator SpoVG [Candidatus Muiribacteriota bacterium]